MPLRAFHFSNKMTDEYSPDHKAGFVSIIGRPNVGKSTLMNQLVGVKVSIINSKAQTTRHRIFGILNGEDFQIVYSDTPGTIEPKYQLQKSMMRFVQNSLIDADLILFLIDPYVEYQDDDPILAKLQKTDIPIILILNKIDLIEEGRASQTIELWRKRIKALDYLTISALEGANLEKVMDLLLANLPTHPPFYPKDALTDRPERFFAAEIIREKVFSNYKKEIPYSTEVAITEFKEEPKIIRMRAELYVERKSQKGIIIGHQGKALKKVGTEARLDLEEFFQKKVFLETHVKVAKDWRKNERQLKRFGY